MYFIHHIVDINNGRAIQTAPMATVNKSEAELLIKILLKITLVVDCEHLRDTLQPRLPLVVVNIPYYSIKINYT